MANGEGRILQGKYDLLSQLGAGGMGSVWLARDLMLERKVALKELLKHSNNGPDRAERRTRVLSEARAMARVIHPAIVKIYDVFRDDDDDPWIVMEYIRGRSLAQLIEQGTLDERTVAAIGLPVLDGLRAAHRAGVMHRDVKPANILVADDDSIFLVDFGIAKIAGDPTLTSQSRILGTTEFMAPERLLGHKLTPASDLWSLGVTFFCALEGYSPFVRPSFRNHEAVIASILSNDPPPLEHKGRLADLVLRLLEKDPDRRPGSGEVDAELTLIKDSKHRSGRASEPTTKSAHVVKPEQSRQHGRGAAVPAPSPAPAGAGAGDGRQLVTDPRAGKQAVKLMGMSQENAARQLAGCPPRDAAEILQVMAISEAEAAGAILQMVSLKGAGRTMNYLSADAAASILSTMPITAAARILNSTGARAAGGVIMALPAATATRLLECMEESHAADVLGNVEPATVAALLGNLNDPSRRLLVRLSPSVRTQVLRHMRSRPGQ